MSHYSISGIYFFSKIINYSDLPPLKPASTLVMGVRWITKFKGGKTFLKLEFPPDFSVEIASEVCNMVLWSNPIIAAEIKAFTFYDNFQYFLDKVTEFGRDYCCF